jgi:hypothetical protein
MLRTSIQQDDLTLGFEEDQLPKSSAFSFDIQPNSSDNLPSKPRTRSYGSVGNMSIVTRMQLFANRLLYTRTYAIIYIVCLLLNLVLLIYGASHFAALRSSSIRGGEVPGWYAVLDVVATLVLVLEVLIRIAAGTKLFFKSWLNWIDSAVLGFSFLALFLYSVDPGVILAENFILITRYSAQLFRTYLILKKYAFVFYFSLKCLNILTSHLERNSRLQAMDNQIDFNMLNNEINVNDEKRSFIDLDDDDDDDDDVEFDLDDDVPHQIKVTNVALRK